MRGKLTVLYPPCSHEIHGVLYPPHQDVSFVEVVDSAPDCEKLQRAVEGYIELVPNFNNYKGNPCVVFCNEEGKLNGLDVNLTATHAWHEVLAAAGIPCTDVLVGPVAIVTGDNALLEGL